MRPGQFLGIPLCALIFCASVWGAPKSFVAVVNEDGTPARSGPGVEYYPAEALRRGDRVEVFRVDEGGWCAVRPPAGSFSWVLASNLRPTETEGVAEVIHDEVLAFVGSRVRKQRDVVQVRLNRGELVEVVGSDELKSEETGKLQTWLRIVPPAGEFRWVHLEYVDRERQTRPAPAVAVAAAPVRPDFDPHGDAPSPTTDAHASGNGAADTTASDLTAGPGDDELASRPAGEWKPLPPGTLKKRHVPLASKTPTAATNGMAATEQAMDARGVDLAANVASGGSAPGVIGPVDAAPIAIPGNSASAHSANRDSAVVAASGAEQLNTTSTAKSESDELAELDVKFSLMVAKPVHQWQLEPLMLRLKGLAEAGQTLEVRNKAALMLQKMVEFTRLQSGGSPLGRVFSPAPATATQLAMQVPPPNPLTQTVPVSAGGLPGRPVTQPAAGGMNRLLAAMESLMPPAPGRSTAEQVGQNPAYQHATGSGGAPLVQAVSMQSPETAPPAPGGLAWNATSEPRVRLPVSTAAVGSGVSASMPADPSAAWRAPGSVPPNPANTMAAGTAGTAGMLDRLKDTLLYPLGAGTASAGAGAATSPAYDGQGWLVPVVSRLPGPTSPENYMPPFALTDQEGKVVRFVTPAPGVNLHRYVRKEIGIFGHQRPMTHLKEPHITASRIVMLDRHRR